MPGSELMNSSYRLILEPAPISSFTLFFDHSFVELKIIFINFIVDVNLV